MGNICSVSAEVKPATGPEGKGGGTAWKTNEEEDEQILQGVKEKMRRKDAGTERGASGDSLQWFFIKASGES